MIAGIAASRQTRATAPAHFLSMFPPSSIHLGPITAAPAEPTRALVEVSDFQLSCAVAMTPASMIFMTSPDPRNCEVKLYDFTTRPPLIAFDLAAGGSVWYFVCRTRPGPLHFLRRAI